MFWNRSTEYTSLHLIYKFGTYSIWKDLERNLRETELSSQAIPWANYVAEMTSWNVYKNPR